MKTSKIISIVVIFIGFSILLSSFNCSKSKVPTLSCSDLNCIFPEKSVNKTAEGISIFIDISRPMANFVTRKNTPYLSAFTILETRLRARFQEKREIFNFGSQVTSTNRSLMDYVKPDLKNKIYNASSTRLDLVLKRILNSRQNNLFLIITDAEAEGPGGVHENPLLGDMVSNMSQLIEKNLTIRIIGLKSQWKGNIQRPCYVFLIGPYQEVKDFSHFNSIDQHRANPLIISKQILKTNSSTVELQYEGLDNVQPMDLNQEKQCFNIKFKGFHLMKLAFKVTFDKNHPYFKFNTLNPKIELLSKEVQGLGDSCRTCLSEAVKLKNVISEYNGDYLDLKFEVMPFNWKKKACASQICLNASKSDLELSLPAWIRQMSTNERNNYSKTYLFAEIIESLVSESLLNRNSFQITKFYLLF